MQHDDHVSIAVKLFTLNRDIFTEMISVKTLAPFLSRSWEVSSDVFHIWSPDAPTNHSISMLFISVFMSRIRLHQVEIKRSESDNDAFRIKSFVIVFLYEQHEKLRNQ